MSMVLIRPFTIRRRSDYVMGIITPAIGPNSSKKLTQYPRQSLNENSMHAWLHTQQVFLYSNFAAVIV